MKMTFVLEGLDEQQIKKYEQMLKIVPEDGTSIGNVTLLGKLKWKEEVFWEIRDKLIDLGVLEKGRGKGGSVRRVLGVQSQQLSSEKIYSEAERIKEKELYEPMATVIKERWIKDNRFDDAIVEIVAQQGRRETGGKWTRPDIVVASLTTFAYVPGKFFDLITFEVKPHDAVDITVVYEALAHLRASTKSYVLLHIPKPILSSYQDIIEQICEEAKRHGIGVIIAEDPAKYETWEEKAEAYRREPDPEKLNEFITVQTNQAFKEKIIKWLR